MNIRHIIPIVVLFFFGIVFGGNTFASEIRLIPIPITDNGPLPQNAPFGDMPAYIARVPEGWHYDGRVVWDIQTNKLATFELRLTGPDNSGIHAHNHANYIWNPAEGIGGDNSMYPEGSHVSGAVVLRPVSAADYLKLVIIPSKRANYEIVGEQQLPNYANAAAQQAPLEAMPSADAAVVRIRYNENGVTLVEDFYTAIVSVQYYTLLLHSPIEVFSLRAPEGKLEGYSPFLYSLYRTITVEPVWYANLFNIGTIALEQRRNQIEMAGIISSMLVKNANEVHEAIMNTWKENEATRAYILNNATDTILGLGDYRNPNTGEEIKLPNNYQSIWWGIDGSYIYSDNANYDPNLNGGNIQYYKMQNLN